MTGESVFDTPYDQLPNPRQVWVGSPGSCEEGLGKLSLLTPDVVSKAAATEVKTGERVTLGWELTKLELANMNRQPCQHHIISLLNGYAFDDVYIMNPRRFNLFLEVKTKRINRQKNRVVSGMVSAISPSRSLPTVKRMVAGSSMEGQLLPKFSIQRMTGLECNTGLVKGSQVL